VAIRPLKRTLHLRCGSEVMGYKSNRLDAIFRVDADNEIGGGHLVRCISLAEKLYQNKWSCIFICNRGTIKASAFLKLEKIELCELNCNKREESNYIKRRYPDGCNLFVIDHYDKDYLYEKEFEGWARKILIIDDLNERRHFCNFYLNSAVGETFLDYKKMVPENCQAMLGPSFALLRSEFLLARKLVVKRRMNDRSVRRILICFGLIDKRELVLKSLTILKRMGNQAEVDVIIGSNAGHINRIRDAGERCNFGVNIHEDSTDVAELMSNADFAVGACGVSAWERCCLGLPSVAVMSSRNQRYIAGTLKKEFAAEVVGDCEPLKDRDIELCIVRMSKEASLRRRISRNSLRITDGLGAMRVFELIAGNR